MNELMAQDGLVVMAGTQGVRERRVGELLPLAFDKEDMQ